MPVSKVDSRCFNLCKKVNDFLSLENVGRPNLTPPEFWKELSLNEEAVSSYIVCLIAKLISLDSDHGLKPLPHVYRELVELQVDYSKYRSWAAKPLPANARSSGLELQFSIIRTIKHLKEWHGFVPSIHLRHMYLRWNLARNSDDTKKADGFEESVIKTFSVAQSKEVTLQSPARRVSFKEGVCFMSDKEEMELVRVLVESVFFNHRRAQFGRLPPDQCRLREYGNDNLSYVRLRHLVSKKPHLLKVATVSVLTTIQKEISHSQDYKDREVLLPMLHLFRELLTMLGPVDTIEVYQAVIPFYTWPLAHADFTRRILDMILLEGRVRGTTFRRKLMAEQDVGLKMYTTRIRQQLVHMMVDTSHPLSRGALFNDIFQLQQEQLSQQDLQRMVIRNCFKSVLPHDIDVVELEAMMKRLPSDVLRRICQQALEVTESAAYQEEDSGKTLVSELKTLQTSIKEHAESDEQRDSAVSCSSSDSELQFSEDTLSSFPLPAPYFQTHPLDNNQLPTIIVKLKDILIKAQQKITPKLSRVSAVDESEVKIRSLTISIESTPEGENKSLANGHVTTNGDHMLSNEDHLTSNGSHVSTQGSFERELSQDSPPLSPAGEPPRTIATSTSCDVSPTHTREGQQSPDSGLSSQDAVKLRPQHLLERRQTFCALEKPRASSVSRVESMGATSPSGSRQYSGSRARSNSINPLQSLRTQLKRKSTSYSTSVKQRSRKGSASVVLSPTHKPSLKLVKVVLAGNDLMVSHAAKAYAHLRTEEPNLFSGLELRFYHVPLSRTSTIYDIEMGGASVGTAPPPNPELPEPMMEHFDSSGNDVHIGRFLSHMDSWYERNLMVAVHHLLRLLPSDVPYDAHKCKDERPMSPIATEEESPRIPKIPITPAKLLIDTVAQYTQEAGNCIHMKLFRVKMSLKSEKSNKIEHREVIMLHRLDIQRLSGKKQSRQVKPFEANITMTEITLDNSLRRSDIMEAGNVWSVRASNVPRAGDTGVPNPENESFELTIIKVHVEGSLLKGSKTRFQEESLHHTCDLVLETRDKPLTVMVDSDVDALIENVVRVEVIPAYLDQSFRAAATTNLMRRNDYRTEQQMDFPLMTFWPIDL